MFAIKAEIADATATHFDFAEQKTMYGGKRIAVGDVVYLFASENQGGAGLVARGVVMAAEATPRVPGVQRQTPRVSLRVKRTHLRHAVSAGRPSSPFPTGPTACRRPS